MARPPIYFAYALCLATCSFKRSAFRLYMLPRLQVESAVDLCLDDRRFLKPKPIGNQKVVEREKSSFWIIIGSMLYLFIYPPKYSHIKRTISPDNLIQRSAVESIPT